MKLRRSPQVTHRRHLISRSQPLAGHFVSRPGAVTSRWDGWELLFVFKSSKEDEDSSPPHLRMAVDVEGVCCVSCGVT
ncbi:hypothetical protein VZT92_010649 [Zoarces viviparus]|uniref:Uncharacterized protein n=1 Tax=Zoarces viviparus TaxID=48416 RepID=A0AAW1F8X8_ZOAVI